MNSVSPRGPGTQWGFKLSGGRGKHKGVGNTGRRGWGPVLGRNQIPRRQDLALLSLPSHPLPHPWTVSFAPPGAALRGGASHRSSGAWWECAPH